MIKANKLFLTVLVSAALAACGGGGSSTPANTTTATSNVTAAVNATTVAAIVNQPFTFANGISEFGTTSPTTVTFTSSSATPAFAISAGGVTASGTTTFGSCIFTFTASTFPAASPLAIGKTIRIPTCSLALETFGENANGVPVDISVQFQLGSTLSTAARRAVSINSTGQVVINGVNVGTVTTAFVTGS